MALSTPDIGHPGSPVSGVIITRMIKIVFLFTKYFSLTNLPVQFLTKERSKTFQMC